MVLETVGSSPITHLFLMPLGYRQVVRHSTLTAACVGSNPTSPVYILSLVITVRLVLSHDGFFFYLWAFSNLSLCYQRPSYVMVCYPFLSQNGVKIGVKIGVKLIRSLEDRNQLKPIEKARFPAGLSFVLVI